ncbi:uncharacterized protein LOC107359809 [Tetranychus urticae]|uniref:uncharacterized protein LOC107359809 n=1 Tax=Tetranychus urticae TaxID=32264 RepID=UPI000D656F8A|nr:uncharacterized protein LOC107359809 [Tetranychus urticae]
MFAKLLFVFIFITSFECMINASESIEELEQEMRSLPIKNPFELAKLLNYVRSSVVDSQTFRTIKIGITNIIGGCECNKKSTERQKPKSAEKKPFYVRLGYNPNKNVEMAEGHILVKQKDLP